MRACGGGSCLKAFVALLVSAAAYGTPGVGTRDTPLLDYAVRLRYDTMPHAEEYRDRAAAAEAELERVAPPRANCSGALGAARYAATYRRIADARSELDEHDAAADAYRRAAGCAPRDASLYGSICTELLNLGDEAEARTAAARGLAIDARDYDSNACLANLDFANRDWAHAVGRIRTLVSLARDDELATYWQIVLWLAETRAGATEPQLVRREPTTAWPRPILDFLRSGREQDVLRWLLEHNDGETSLRERLCEALFYAGQRRLALGDEAAARRYFAAAINLKVPYFVEHQLARVALRKLGRGSAP